MAAPATRRAARAPSRSVGTAERRAVAAVPSRRRRPHSALSRRRLILVLSVALAVGSLIAVAGSYAYLTQGQVRLARLQEQLNSQSSERRLLELEISELEQPTRVMSEAQGQGLVVPSKVTDIPQVSLTAGGTAGNAGR